MHSLVQSCLSLPVVLSLKIVIMKKKLYNFTYIFTKRLSLFCTNEFLQVREKKKKTALIENFQIL